MRSLFERLDDAKRCPDCQIIKQKGFNEVRFCEPCKQNEKTRESRLDAMSLDDYITEVVNGRVMIHESKKNNYALYEKYHEEMPYGTAKARDGDPDEWMYEQLMNDYEHLIEEEESA